MKITKNAKIFTLINSISSLLFLYLLNNLVMTQNFKPIAPTAIGYALIWFISGLILGITDKTRNYRGNVDFQYLAISATIQTLTIWLAKVVFPAIMPLAYTQIAMITLMVAIAIVIYYIFSERNVKGIDKKEAFK